MSLELHPKAVARLKEVFRNEIASLEVTNGFLLDFRTTAGLANLDKVLPATESAIGTQIRGFVSDEPASDFVFDRLQTELLARPHDTGAPRIKLLGLPEFADLDSVVSRLVDEFTSLPWTYAVFIPLPESIKQIFARVQYRADANFSHAVGIHTVAPGQTEYPEGEDPTGTLSSLLSANKVRLMEGTCYLRVELRGFAPQYGSSRPLEAMELVLRAFFGLGLALRVFARSHLHTFGTPELRLPIWLQTDQGWQFTHTHRITDDTASAVLGMTSDSRLSEESMASRLGLTADIDRFRSLFGAPEENENLVRACAWLFDSHASTSPLYGFIQGAITLEILLGDRASSDLIGLGELLANRCAYLIGRSRRQREEVVKDFRRIYETRSRIVHRGQTRLSRSEVDDLYTLRWMCARVIQEELRLASADQRG